MIGKPLPSNAYEPMAEEYQLYGNRNSDIFRFQHHRETLEDPKLSSVWWCLCYKNGKKRCAWGQCCKFSNFVARISYFPTPFETFFKSLGTNIATCWTNLIQVFILPTDLYSSLYRSVNLPLWCNLWHLATSFSYFQLKAVGNTAWGTCNTHSRYPEGIGNGIWNLFYYSAFILWL